MILFLCCSFFSPVGTIVQQEFLLHHLSLSIYFREGKKEQLCLYVKLGFRNDAKKKEKEKSSADAEIQTGS